MLPLVERLASATVKFFEDKSPEPDVCIFKTSPEPDSDASKLPDADRSTRGHINEFAAMSRLLWGLCPAFPLFHARFALRPRGSRIP